MYEKGKFPQSISFVIACIYLIFIVFPYSPSYLVAYLIFQQQLCPDKPFRTLLVDSVDPAFRSKFMQQSIIQFIKNLNIVFPKEQEQYIYSYILNGSTGVIIQWIRSDYCIDENELVDLLFSINQSALVNLDIKPRI